MQVTETNTESLRREFKITVSKEDLNTRLNDHLESIKGQVQLKGFRPGKVPVAHLKKAYGKGMMGEIVQEVINEGSQKAIEDNELRPAITPKVDIEGEIETVVEGGDLTFTMAVDLMPEIDIMDFAELELTKLVAEVADDDINQAIERIAEQNRTYSPRDEGQKAEQGDALTIDFLGRVGDEEFDGGKGDDARIVIGSNQFIPGFEDQLVGATAGQETKVEVTFPEDYGVEDLAGKDAVFDVTVKEVSSADEIVVDDELATKLGLESLEKLKEAIKEQIGQDYDGFSQAKMKRALLDRLDEVHSFDVPTAMLDAEFDQVWHQYENHSGDKDKEDEGKSEDELKAEYREIAARRVRLGLLMSEVGRVNNITVDQDEVSRAIAERARQFPGQEQQLFEFYQKSPDALAQIRAPLFEDKVVNFITELAKITEESVSKADLMKDPDEDSEGDADKD